MFVAMLRQLLCIIFLGISFLAFSDNGGEETIYLDERMKETKKKNAFYYCELTKTPDDTFSVKAYFLSGELKMEGKYLDEAMEIPHGSFVYYYESGQVESKGEYRDGEKYGIWQRFDKYGNEKPEKVYAYLPILKEIRKEE